MRIWWLLSNDEKDCWRMKKPVSRERPVRVECVHVPVAVGTARLTLLGVLLGLPRRIPSACRYSAAFGHCVARLCSVATPASVGSRKGVFDVTFPKSLFHCAAAKKKVLSLPL